MLESKIILHSTKNNNKARIRNTVFTFKAVVWSSIWRLPLLCLFFQRNSSVFQLAQFVWQNSTVATAFRRILRLFVHSFHCLFCGLDYFCLFRSIDLWTFLSVFWWPVARPDDLHTSSAHVAVDWTLVDVAVTRACFALLALGLPGDWSEQAVLWVSIAAFIAWRNTDFK